MEEDKTETAADHNLIASKYLILSKSEKSYIYNPFSSLTCSQINEDWCFICFLTDREASSGEDVAEGGCSQQTSTIEKIRKNTLKASV